MRAADAFAILLQRSGAFWSKGTTQAALAQLEARPVNRTPAFLVPAAKRMVWQLQALGLMNVLGSQTLKEHRASVDDDLVALQQVHLGHAYLSIDHFTSIGCRFAIECRFAH